MEAIGFTFNDFDLIVYPFDFSCMDGMITVIDDAIAMALKHGGKIG